MPDAKTDPRNLILQLSIWHSTKLPQPQHQVDMTDKANPRFTGLYFVDGNPATLEEHRAAMDDINQALTGNHRAKAKYLK